MKNNLPVMLLKRIVLLPLQDVRLDLNNDISSKVIDLAMYKHNGEILIVCPVDPYEESPDVSDLPSVGVVGKIKSKMELPNGNLRIVVSGTKRVKILEYVNEIADGDILKAHTMEIDLPKFDEVEEITLRRKLLELLNAYIECSSLMSNSVLSSVKDINDINKITDIIVSFMPFTIEKKLLYMQEINPLHRANALVYDLSIELQVAQLDLKLDDALREDFERNQKEFVLREKMDEIKKQLGENDIKDELIADYLEKINSLKCDGRLKNKLVNEVKKLDYTNDASPEVSQIRNYLDLLLDLPFGILSEDENDLDKISEGKAIWYKVLDERNISYVAWNISNTKGSASILKTDSTSRINFTDSALKPWGIWYKEWVKAKMNK